MSSEFRVFLKKMFDACSLFQRYPAMLILSILHYTIEYHKRQNLFSSRRYSVFTEPRGYIIGKGTAA
jgi:hypothetical protein